MSKQTIVNYDAQGRVVSTTMVFTAGIAAAVQRSRRVRPLDPPPSPPPA